MSRASVWGFTLVELLVVCGIVAIAAALLLPVLAGSRQAAMHCQVNSDLRQITIALHMYQDANAKEVPPTRFSCSTRTAYELPIELLGYLPTEQARGVDVVRMADPFSESGSYLYRAPGPAILNESSLLSNAATLWIPDGFPYGADDGPGSYHNDPKTAPVRYAVWSPGPVLNSPKFDIPGRLPVPKKYWFDGTPKGGVVVHMQMRNRQMLLSVNR